MQTSNAKKTLLKLFFGNGVLEKIRATLATNSAPAISQPEIEDGLIDSMEYVTTKDYRIVRLEAEAQRARAHRIPRVRAR